MSEYEEHSEEFDLADQIEEIREQIEWARNSVEQTILSSTLENLEKQQEILAELEPLREFKRRIDMKEALDNAITAFDGSGISFLGALGLFLDAHPNMEPEDVTEAEVAEYIATIYGV